MGKGMGIGFAAFMNGLDNGMDMGQKARGIWDANVQRGEIKDGQERAEEARNKDAEAMVKTYELDGPPVPAEKRSGLGGFVSGMFGSEPEKPKPEMAYEFNGKRYGSMDDAMAEALKELDSTDVYFDKQRDQMQKNMLKRTGNAEMSEQFGLFMDDRENRRTMRHGADAYRQLAMGDIGGGIESFNKVLDASGDDWNIIGHEAVNGEDGSLQGYKLSMQGKDGRKWQQNMTPDQMVEYISTHQNPEALFKSIQARKDAAAEAQAKIAADDRKSKWEMMIDDNQHANNVNRDAVNNQAKDARQERDHVVQLTRDEKKGQRDINLAQLKDQLKGGGGKEHPLVKAALAEARASQKNSIGYDGKVSLDDNAALNGAVEKVARANGITVEEYWQRVKEGK